jgi:hypothetical protein
MIEENLCIANNSPVLMIRFLMMKLFNLEGSRLNDIRTDEVIDDILIKVREAGAKIYERF